ncbi:MAG: PDZ domain-containing protein [Candidatus Eisenbacteria bacterium]|nr:PDZ domain-containing protein [Candidatus Eisenbacteria bacterium]
MKDMARAAAWSALAAAAALLAFGCAGSGGRTVAEFAIDTCSDAIYIPVKWRGDEHLLLLDTGASLCIFDASLRHQLGEPIGRSYVSTHSGVEAVELYRAPDLSIGEGGLNADDPVICQDLLALQTALDRRISGILGMSFARDYALQLDVDAGRLRFLTSPVPDTLAEGAPLRIELEPHRTPEMSVDIGDTSEWRPVIDTGCSTFGSIDYRRCEVLLERGVLQDVGTVRIQSPHHSRVSNLVALDTLRVGPFLHRGVVLSRSESSVLGLPFIYGYNLILDFPDYTAYMERRSPPIDTGFDNPQGMAVYGSPDGLVVSAVSRGGPSESAGVRPGDRLVAIGGERIGAPPLACLYDALRAAPNDTLEIGLLRDGETLTVEILPGKPHR